MVVVLKKPQCTSLIKDGSRRCSKNAIVGTPFCHHHHHQHVYYESDSDDTVQVKATSSSSDEDDDVASETDAWKASHAFAAAITGSGDRPRSTRFAATKARNNLPRGRGEKRLELQFKEDIRKLVADTKEAKNRAITTEYHQTLNAITFLLENVILLDK